MDTVVWQALITAALAAYIEWSRRRSEKAVREAAVAAEQRAETRATKAAAAVKEVKTTLAENTENSSKQLSEISATGKGVVAAVVISTAATEQKLADIHDTTIKTETLVNNQTSILKKDRAADKRRIAELTGDPADMRAALLAEQASEEHEIQQRKVDAKEAEP